MAVAATLHGALAMWQVLWTALYKHSSSTIALNPETMCRERLLTAVYGAGSELRNRPKVPQLE